ncbi:phage repressor protein/antirepressor Ant [Bacillus cereus]|uniref:BRO family protein n=2 Tax=Bacillus nitratireducens TaxID=2026193 RepID=UPI000BECA2D2|nr:phage repressor protein/antirepressor Ant [Bacillus cereus]PEW01790.1 phage repressor protein/antirepressor Ant [Bacillus cereus]PEZ87320.1 phage repressor protein/antirepressor Ant [Bacillus cereus]PFA30139.1 phage repressor protein/antirepressor Ant [Bacillus cereus]PFB96323.1 phage repressor protein/antirepressor Ant [Bacillus cereus]
MNNLHVFNHSELGQVRTIEQDKVVWFAAKDVCEVLEIQNTTQATQRLDSDEVTMLNIGGLSGNTNFINESGLYSLILASRKPQAKAFKKWVTSEVLPSIRQDGGYIVTTEEDDEQVIIAKALLLAQRTLDRKTQQLKQAEETIKVQTPKVEYVDKVIANEHYCTATDLAKLLGMRSAQELYNELIDKKIIYRSKRKNYLHMANYTYLRELDYIRYKPTQSGVQMEFSEKGKLEIAKLLGIITD